MGGIRLCHQVQILAGKSSRLHGSDEHGDTVRVKGIANLTEIGGQNAEFWAHLANCSGIVIARLTMAFATERHGAVNELNVSAVGGRLASSVEMVMRNGLRPWHGSPRYD